MSSLLTRCPRRRGPEREPRQAGRECGAPEASGRSAEPADSPRHPGLRAWPCPPAAPSASPHAARSPGCQPGVPTRRVPSARSETQASRAGAQPQLGVGRRERKAPPSVPRRSRQGRGGERGTVSVPGQDLAVGGAVSRVALTCPNFLIPGRRGASPGPFWSVSAPWTGGGGRGANRSARLGAPAPPAGTSAPRP